MRKIFLSTPSARRATRRVYAVCDTRRISIHALCEEGDNSFIISWSMLENFYPRPLRGGRRTFLRDHFFSKVFLSTPSARRATFPFLGVCGRAKAFLSTPSARRATSEGEASFNSEIQFLSTPSARRATHSKRRTKSAKRDFYPRPLRGGRPSSVSQRTICRRYFYPRPLRGGRPTKEVRRMIIQEFLSTPSARRATLGFFATLASSASFLSTPSARRATMINCGFSPISTDFYPRPLRGGRLVSENVVPTPSQFLSTPSARRATAKTETKSLFSNKLYNILHEFRRALIYNGSKNDPNHAK